MLRCLLILVVVAPSALWAACPRGQEDLQGKSAIRATRDSPLFVSILSRTAEGDIVEQREQVGPDGTKRNVRSLMQDGLWPVKRESAQGTMELRYGPGLRSFDVRETGRSVSVPLTLLSNGRVTDTGRLEAEVVGRDRLTIGGCRYRVLVVRSTMTFSGAPTSYFEHFHQPDLGLNLGSIAMNADWTPRSGVFFDRIERVRFR